MRAGRRREISRLEAFSDAVVVLALTLLVVSPDVPKSDAVVNRLVTAAGV